MERVSPKFIEALAGPMRRLAQHEAPPFDFWPYVETVPATHLEGHDFLAGQVTYVYEEGSGHYQLVHIDSDRANVFLVIVLDLRQLRVHGHLVLDLNKEYGVGAE